MEKDIHKDHLDDYVRKSFGEYEESPSSGMWDRIESELPAGDQEKTTVGYWRVFRFRWRMAAAILLLISGLVAEHLYYEHKLRTLSTQTVQDQPSNVTKKQERVENSTSDSAMMPGDSYHSGKTIENAGNPVDDRQESTELQHSKRDLASLTLIAPKPSGTEPATSFQNGTIAVVVTDILPETIAAAVLPNPVPETAVPISAETATKPIVPIAAFDPVSRSVQPLVAPTPTIASDIQAIIRPVKGVSGWYAGLHATPRITFDYSRMPGRMQGGRPSYVSRQKEAVFVTDYWLRAGKTIHPHLSLESGIGYSAMTRSAALTPQFRFGDGIHGGGHLRRFHYDLDTYGGATDITLAMERVDSDPISDDEPLSVQITTTEQVQLLRVPLLAALRFGPGRLKGVVKGGLVAHFFLKNELEIEARAPQNSRFQPIQGSGSYTVQREKNRRFFPGYWLSGGIEFRLSRHIGLAAESSFSGDFARTNPNGRPLPAQYSLGLNVGANYYF